MLESDIFCDQVGITSLSLYHKQPTVLDTVSLFNTNAINGGCVDESDSTVAEVNEDYNKENLSQPLDEGILASRHRLSCNTCGSGESFPARKDGSLRRSLPINLDLWGEYADQLVDRNDRDKGIGASLKRYGSLKRNLSIVRSFTMMRTEKIKVAMEWKVAEKVVDRVREVA